jgi:hypothetical protein
VGLFFFFFFFFGIKQRGRRVIISIQPLFVELLI